MELLREQYSLLLELFAIKHQGVVVLSPEDTMLLCTPPARRLLRRYFRTANPKRRGLPLKLRHWLNAPELPAVANDKISPLSKPLLVERDGGKLSVRLFLARTPGRRILLLEEKRAAHSIKPLQKHLGLSLREAEVLFWVSQGKKDSGIGIILGVSTATVEKHLEHILAKLNVETRTTAALYAYEVLHGETAHV